jgi:hypothetical protein
MFEPFSKRVGVWNEEAFAGLSILLLIVLVLLAWWGLDKRSASHIQNAASVSEIEHY